MGFRRSLVPDDLLLIIIIVIYSLVQRVRWIFFTSVQVLRGGMETTSTRSRVKIYRPCAILNFKRTYKHNRSNNTNSDIIIFNN